jgi:SRSO17 transposase
MYLEDCGECDERFSRYIKGLASVIGHADRINPLRDYCSGLMPPRERKSVEPMAAVMAPEGTAAHHQSLLHFASQALWSDEKVLAKVCELVLPAIERAGPLEAWILVETGFPKKDKHSVGVARQYCEQLRRQDNCQAAVSLSLANRHASLPVRYRLYLPQEWADDAARRRKAHIPEEIVFKSKPEIALEQVRWAYEAGLPRGVVLLDAGYGKLTHLRTQINALGLTYVAGILSSTSVWAPATTGLLPRRYSGRGRPPTRSRRGKGHKPVSVEQLASSLPLDAWRTVTWRECSSRRLSSRFACVRVRAARRSANGEVEWLLIEWPKAEKAPTKYWLSTLPPDIAMARLVHLAKLRWRIERDYHELKQELGLGDFEGRSWRGFHHHATMCIAGYGFLLSEQEALPPSARCPAALIGQLELPADYRPRGAADPNRAARAKVDRHHAAPPDRRAHPTRAAMSLLRRKKRPAKTSPPVAQ